MMELVERFYEAGGGMWSIVGFGGGTWRRHKSITVIADGGDSFEFISPEDMDPFIEAITEARRALVEELEKER
jgi:hypothetical protein